MSLIHPSALVSPEADLHPSVKVGPFAIIEPGVTLGEGCTVDAHARLCSGVTMGKNNTVGHGAIIGGDPQDLGFDTSQDSGVLIGDNNTLREYVTIHRSTIPGGQTILGHRNFLMGVSHLAHDVVMGDDNVLANNFMAAGHVHFGNKIFGGGGAGLHQFIKVGDYSMIQGNAGMTKDVPPFCVVHGINQLSGLNIVGLRRASFSPDDRAKIKHAYRILFQSHLTRAEALARVARHQWSEAATVLIDAVRNPSQKGILTR